MFIVVHHTITDQETAFARGENLLAGNGAPPGVRVREFYPSRDKIDVFCLWEGTSLEEVHDYVDATLGDSSRQLYFEVDAGIARGLPVLAAGAGRHRRLKERPVRALLQVALKRHSRTLAQRHHLRPLGSATLLPVTGGSAQYGIGPVT